MAISTLSSTLTSSWLELDSMFCGFPKSIEGGDVAADVAIAPPGADGIAHKHIANVKVDDIVLTFGADMSDSIYDWIAATSKRTFTPKDGAIVGGDMDGRTISRLEFANALVRQITFPSLDASSKDAAAIEIKLTPDQATTTQKGSGSVSKTQSKKQWSVSDFRLQIDGLDCTGVDSIDALIINVDLAPDQVGVREPQKQPAVLNIPNLAFTIAESGAASLISWHEDFLIKGHHTNADEKSGSLQFLAANLQDVIFTLTFRNLGIIKLKKVNAKLGSIPRLRAEMYCEEIAFEYKSVASVGAQPSTKNTSSGTSDASTATPQNIVRPPLRGAYVQGLTKMAGPIARQTQPSPTVANALDLGRPLRFRS